MTTTRVVLDSNVVISGVLFGGNPRRVIELALDGTIEVFTSADLLDEIREVLQRPKFGFSPAQLLSLVAELCEVFAVVHPDIRVRVVTADPEDDRVLECALAAKAQVIVSGDEHLLALVQWKGVRVLSPATFVEELAGS